MEDKKFSLSYFLKFIRLKVSLAVTFSAWAAAVVAERGISSGHLTGITGVFILACGASALNQVQERKYDAKMERTSGRPLPEGVLGVIPALIISILLIISGLLLLSFSENIQPFFLGCFNIIWYNGFYTYLKRKTAFAVVPGSLTGSVPVLMGWTIAGGSLLLAEPWLLAFFMFMWQIPHFWLLMLTYGNQYQAAGLPALPDLFSRRQMRNIIFSWIMAASVSSMMLTILGIWSHPSLKITVIAINIWLITIVIINLFSSEKRNYRQLFIHINVFMIVVLVLLVIDQMIG